MSTPKDPPPPRRAQGADKPAESGREARLAAALRANLRRRKAGSKPAPSPPKRS
jgi:hypothetical protein